MNLFMGRTSIQTSYVQPKWLTEPKIMSLS